MLRIVLCLVLATGPAVSLAAAQRVIVPGDTVRVHLLREVERFDGVVVGVGSGGIQVRGVAAERTIDAASVSGVRVLAGRRPATGRGAILGLAIGAAIGTAGGIAAATDDSGWLDFGPEIIPVSAAVFGVGGALLGGLFGSFMTRDRWVPATMPVAPIGQRAGRLARLVPVIRPGAESSLLIGVRLGGAVSGQR